MDRLEQLQKLAEASPEDPMAHYAVGLELMHRTQYDEAAAAFDRALAVDANYSAAYFHKGKALLTAGRRDEARETLTVGMKVAEGAGDLKTVREMRELRDLI